MNTSIIATVHISMTGGVAKTIDADPTMAAFVFASLERHLAGDWGELCEDDAEANNAAIGTRGRILSSYPLPEPTQVSTNYGPATVDTLWVITDTGWETTTILWPVEY